MNTPQLESFTLTSGTEVPSYYQPIASDLEQVEAMLAREFTSPQPLIAQMLNHGLGMGGKRLRPALVLLAGQAAVPDAVLNTSHFTSGAIMELIHLASLVHDDILDEADLRRHRQTINARWTNELAVLFGDLLLARAVSLAASLNNFQAFEWIGQTSRQLCEGEMLQVANRGNYDLTLETYYQIIRGKTAALLECACRLGAWASGADAQTTERLAKFGVHLGMAFQIIDDLLDLSGTEEAVGKTLGLDIQKQKATLSVIFLLEHLSSAEKAELVKHIRISDEPSSIIKPWLAKTGALEFARSKGEEFVQKADEDLDGIRITSESQLSAVTSLRQIAQFVLVRDH